MRASSAETAADCESMLEQLQRQEVSNPPAFGARIAHLVLLDGELRGQWYRDLVTMSGRIREMRRQLYEGLVRESEFPTCPLSSALNSLLHLPLLFGSISFERRFLSFETILGWNIANS